MDLAPDLSQMPDANDILLEQRKLGGILVETVPAPETGFLIPLIGIGININVSAEEFPDEIAFRATSLLIETGRRHDVNAVAEALLRQAGNFAEIAPVPEILAHWRVLHDPDTRRAFRLDGEEVLCRVLDVSSGGTVTLETPDGSRRTLPAAQVILGDA